MTGKKQPRRTKLIDAALANWISLNQVINELTEDELFVALRRERESSHRRASFVKRLYQRYSALRRDREAVELLRPARAPLVDGSINEKSNG